eukprot:SAG22_NODE_3642_length_1598_cov_2.162775_2_plen_292_part_01
MSSSTDLPADMQELSRALRSLSQVMDNQPSPGAFVAAAAAAAATTSVDSPDYYSNVSESERWVAGSMKWEADRAIDSIFRAASHPEQLPSPAPPQSSPLNSSGSGGGGAGGDVTRSHVDVSGDSGFGTPQGQLRTTTAEFVASRAGLAALIQPTAGGEDWVPGGGSSGVSSQAVLDEAERAAKEAATQVASAAEELRAAEARNEQLQDEIRAAAALGDTSSGTRLGTSWGGSEGSLANRSAGSADSPTTTTQAAAGTSSGYGLYGSPRRELETLRQEMQLKDDIVASLEAEL